MKGRTAEQEFRIEVAGRAGGEWQTVGAFPGDGPGAGFEARWERDGNRVRLRARPLDGAPAAFDQLRATVSFPLLNYGHVVVPDCGRHYVNVSKGLDIRAPLYRVTASNAGHPFFAVADETGAFMLAFGIVSPTGEVEVRRVLPRISRRKAMVGGDELLSTEYSWAPKAGGADLALEFYVDEQAPTWIHALRGYTDAVKAAEGIAYPVHPAAWEPVWCTWTAFCSSEMTAERVLANARICRDMGIGTIILDDGWFGTGLDDDEGELNLGDYEADPRKFPDLAQHVRDLQALGLKVLLWHAPLCVASTSRTYEKMKRYLIRQDGKEFVSVNGLAQLCPACPEVRAYVADETERLLKQFPVDGLKVDLYNCLPVEPCDSTEHAHDVRQGVDAVEATMAVQWERARAVKPDVFFELKQDYGNVRFARHGTQVRAGDTAYDLDTNCRRCFYVQAYAGCVHNDYFVTSVHARERTYAHAMIRMLAAGVPTFGMNMLNLPARAREVLKTWLGFYNARRAMFQTRREPQNNELSAWQGGDAGEAWVAAIWSCREVRIPRAARVWLMNGTGDERLYVRADEPLTVRVLTHDFKLRPRRARTLRLRDGARLAVPPGGLAEITPA